MILSGQAIRERLGNDIVIEPFDASQLNPNSYNLTLHNELMVYEELMLDMAKANRIAVVLAHREFEAWFLAATSSLVAQGKLPVGVEAPAAPEAVADPKAWLSAAMGRRYSETIDQPAFTALFDARAARRCGSFDKLVREFEAMVRSG